jgi:hypothetical protein
VVRCKGRLDVSLENGLQKSRCGAIRQSLGYAKCRYFNRYKLLFPDKLANAWDMHEEKVQVCIWPD